jgi:hypothetical protein
VSAAGIIAAALFYALIGLAALLRPARLLEDFDILAETPDSQNEIRAVYGGFPLTVAGLLAFCLTGTPLAGGILFALALASAGMAAGRLVSALIDRRLGRYPAIFAVLELIVAGLIAGGI